MTMRVSRVEELVLKKISAGDDPDFWSAAVARLLGDVEAHDLDGRGRDEVVLQIGACSHWSHPHWVRWTDGGGFAWPSGYQGAGAFGDGLPKLNWYVLARYDERSESWVEVDRFWSKHLRVLRVALPTRTRRHNQAVVNAAWMTCPPASPRRKVARFYGFRKQYGAWRCVAVKEFPREPRAKRRR